MFYHCCHEDDGDSMRELQIGKLFLGRNMSLPSIAVSIEVSRNFIYCLGFLTISELWRKCLLTFGNLAQHFQLEKSFQNSECVARI